MSKRLTLQIAVCIALLASGLSLVRDIAEARDLRVLQQRNLERMRLYEHLLPENCLDQKRLPLVEWTGRVIYATGTKGGDYTASAAGGSSGGSGGGDTCLAFTNCDTAGRSQVWETEVWEDRRDRISPYTQNVVFDCK